MPNADGLEKQLEQQLADVHARIQELVREIDCRDELIADLQRRIHELKQPTG
jgi:hypothetical protein